MSADDEIVEAFVEERRENLAQLDIDLVALEARPDECVMKPFTPEVDAS